jgi:hypothetical protein
VLAESRGPGEDGGFRNAKAPFPMTTMPPAVEDFRSALAGLRPDAAFRAEGPRGAGSGWWLDVDTLPVAYRDGRGFGLYAPEEEEPGLWVSCPVETAAAVAARLPSPRHA